MVWSDFIAKGVVRKVSVDMELSKSLVKMSNSRIEFLKKQIIADNSASILASEYYEALREVCEAIFAAKGFKVYSHEAITSFIKEILMDDNSAYIFDRYRKIRNSINYYGKQIGKEEARKASIEIPKLIEFFKSKYL